MTAAEQLDRLRGEIEAELATVASLRGRRNELMQALRDRHMALADIGPRAGIGSEGVRSNLVRNKPVVRKATRERKTDDLLDELVELRDVLYASRMTVRALEEERVPYIQELRAEGWAWEKIGLHTGTNKAALQRFMASGRRG